MRRAGRIAVAITGGGVERIEITDDGCGMSAADLELAVQRHCTSKLHDGDLVRIRIWGFEARHCRASARQGASPWCRARRTRRSPPGSRLRAAWSPRSTPAPGSPGTRVTVEDLFYATPARRKFLKSARSEADAVEAGLRRLAMAAPGVACRLTIEQRVVFDLPAQDRFARLSALLGADAAETALAIDAEREGCRLTGFICAPSITRATSAGQSLVVNDRPVTDPTLRTALRVAYRDVIAHGRYPVAALWLDMPPEELDVNVHPAKSELRFRQADLIRSLVIGTVQRALAGGAGGAAPRPALSGFRPSMHLTPPQGPRHTGFAEAQLPYLAAPAARALAEAPAASAEHPLGAPVAQVLDTYVIAATADQSLVLIDQHAAHERLTHEALRAQFLDGPDGVRMQPLLLPAVVDLPAADAHRLTEHAASLARLGLEIEGFGPGAVLVRALPAALGAPDPAPLLRDIADELADSGETVALDAKLDAVIARMACHGSIRAGRRLTLAEMDALLRQMEATPRAATCSHGRPTFLKLTRSDIERLFQRS